MDIKSELKRISSLVDPKIIKLLKNKEITSIASTGKRLRAALVYKSYQACGGKDITAIIDICVAIELVHLYLLIHDDFIDKGKIRRGKKTVHEVYKNFHKIYLGKNKSTQFGNNVAICAGDLINHLACKVIINSRFIDKLKLKALEELHNRIIVTAYGEALETYFAARKVITEKEVVSIYDYKTSKYTFELPLKIGAIFANANKKHIKFFTDISQPLGYIFQLQDDVLGTFGNKKETGKDIRSDIMEGKQTLLIVKAYEKASKAQLKYLNKYFGNPLLTKPQFEKIKEIISETGSLDYCKRSLSKSSEELKDILKQNKSLVAPRHLRFFQSLVDYLINRVS